MADLSLRAKVTSRDAPGWVHAAIVANTTLHSKLRRLRRELEYAKAPWPSGGGGGSAGGAVAMRRRRA